MGKHGIVWVSLWRGIINSVNTDITKGLHRLSQDFSKGGGGNLCQSEGTRLFGHF